MSYVWSRDGWALLQGLLDGFLLGFLLDGRGRE